MTNSSFVSFHPPQRILMGPGPSDVNPRILEAMSRPTIGHLDPQFVSMMDELKDLLRYAFQTNNEVTIPISAPGSAGMETCFANLVEPSDKVIICRNGVFGGRMLENVQRCGGEAIMVDDPWGRAVDIEKVAEALNGNPDAKILAFVHAETSTGAMSDAKALAKLAHEHDCIVIADTVTSLGGVPVKVDEWELDAVYSGTQKCLSCIPGLSPVTFNNRSMEKIKNRKKKCQSWFLDISLMLGYWDGGGKRAYHHTAPINPLYGLHEALILLHDEGLENAWARHRLHHNALKAGLEALGLELVVPEGERLPQLNAVSIPEGIEDAAVRKNLLDAYNLEIGAGLGESAGKLWRIGLMGYSARRGNVLYCISALEAVLGGLGSSVPRGKALEAATAVYKNK
jgi:alanine-glyoxylate transaminase/serine-glyoxylate transaminase/serine-pyruvate transaminase